MNPKFDETQIEKLLAQATPGTSGRLERRLSSAPWTSLAVKRRSNLRWSTVAVLIVALIFAASPQGYAMAQDVLQFFTRTESDTYYDPVSNLTFEDTTPFHDECGIPISPTCSVEQIRGMVEFEVKEARNLPEGLHFIGATGGPDFVELKYGYPSRWDGNLGIGVEAVGRPSYVGTGVVAKSAQVEPVQIGNLPGEYYTGILFQDDAGNVTWQPDDPTATLRWEDGGSTYTLIYYSRTIPLTKEDLIAVAESMTTQPIVK